MSDGDAPLDDIVVELAAREPLFHRLELGTTRADFEAATVPDFWEVGASGAIYDRDTVWTVLKGRYSDPSYAANDPWETSDFGCRRIAPDTYLLTYTLRQEARVTRRLTVWQRHDGRWRTLYHQGTIVADAP